MCKVISISQVPAVVVVLRLSNNNGPYYKDLLLSSQKAQERTQCSLYKPHASVGPEHLVNPVLKLVKLMIWYPVAKYLNNQKNRLKLLGFNV